MKVADWRQVYKSYKGKWVAVENGTDQTLPVVIASGKTLKETLGKARKLGHEDTLMAQIPKKVLPIVGVYRLAK